MTEKLKLQCVVYDEGDDEFHDCDNDIHLCNGIKIPFVASDDCITHRQKIEELNRRL